MAREDQADQYNKLKLVGALAGMKLRLSEFVSALQAVVADSGRWGPALEAFAEVQAAMGDFPAALATAGTIENDETRAAAVTQIGLAQVQAGQTEGARATFASALEAATCIEHAEPRGQALLRIAQAHGKAGDTQEAKATFGAAVTAIRTAEDIEWEDRSAALSCIAVAEAETGFGEQAVRTVVATAADPIAYLATAAALAEVGDKEHFKRLLLPCADSLEAAYLICGPLARLYPDHATALSDIVRAAGSDMA